MQVNLTPHAEELLKEQLVRRAGEAAEQIVERALEHLALAEPGVIPQERESQRRAVEAMREFRRKHRLTLNRGGQSLRDLIHEGHQY